MNWLRQYVFSSIGQKQVMGVAGIGWYFFLFTHLLGNLGMLAGPERFNQYSHLLLHTLAEIVVPIEILFLVLFFVHVVLAVRITIQNKKARPMRYEAHKSMGKATLYSRTMAITGLWILVFIVIHVSNFKYGGGQGFNTVTYDGVEMKDLYGNMMDHFKNPFYTLFYVVSMLCVGLHVAHGLQSSLQTVGFNHPKYNGFAVRFSRLYGLFIGLGFAGLAAWAYFSQGGH